MTPRVEVAPPYAYSVGEESIELARMAGLVLDGWQQDALRLMLAVRADGRWACFEYGEIVARQNGKGAILEARALAALFLLREQLIMWSAHEYKTAMEAFRRVRQLIDRLIESQLIDSDIIKTVNTNGEESFERLDTGQRLKFIARSKSSGRGFSGDVNIIDEAFAYERNMQEALMPTMNARENPQIIYTSSPPLDSFSGEPLFALKARADAGGDESLGWRDWGLAGSLDRLGELNLDDRELWATTNPALGTRITPETIQRNRRSMSPEGFAREILGVWPKQSEGGGEIDARMWQGLCDTDSRRTGEVALAVDVAPHRDYAAIGVYGLRADGIGHVQLSDHRPGTDWIVGRLLELVRALDPVAIVMARGTAASLREDLSAVGIAESPDTDRPRRGELLIARTQEMAAACGQMIDAVRQGSLRHIGQQQLDAAVVGARTRRVGDAVAWARSDNSADISPLVAATLARWGHLTRSTVVDEEQPVPSIW